jgi:hypothetical protein
MSLAEPETDVFAHECRIRDLYAGRLTSLRPRELVAQREVRYANSLIRADLRTLDEDNVIREWEFKLQADYRALGQVLSYVAQAKLEFTFARTVTGVIAAFSIPPEIRLAVQVNNLGIELVDIPAWMRLGGAAPSQEPPRIVVVPALGPSAN